MLPSGDDGPGAVALVRAEGGDLFGFGAREAVVRALAGDPADRRPFRSAGECRRAMPTRCGSSRAPTYASRTAGLRVAVPDSGAWSGAVAALAFAHGWVVGSNQDPNVAHLLPPGP